MIVIQEQNVNDALLRGLQLLDQYGVKEDSRNGEVMVFPFPVATEYKSPWERVLLWPERDANPFFHLMEALWMMEGRNDLEWISHFSSNMESYSDDGETLHGAYGARWRHHFGLDQFKTIIEILKQNPNDRRAVLQMWDAEADLGRQGKDLPCNLACSFRVQDGERLDMHVFNRSNDMIWGAYGANAVHFSVMQEVMSTALGLEMGSYWQISTNFHAYLKTLEPLKPLNGVPVGIVYGNTFPIMSTPLETWLEDLHVFVNEGAVMGFRDPFFKKVAIPMLMAWNCYKDREDKSRYQKAIKQASKIEPEDWRKACVEWLERRYARLSASK